MKKILLLTILVLSFLSSCKDETDDLKKPKEEKISNLKLDKNELNIINSQTLTFNITEGNSPYTVNANKKDFVDITIKGNEITLKALKGGNILTPDSIELTVKDSKAKTQKVNVNIYEKVDVQSIVEELNENITKNIILSSGYYDVIEVSSDNSKVATASKEITQIGGTNLKVIHIQAIKEGTCTISVTDGVETKKIKITVTTVRPVVIKAPLPPEYTAQAISEYNFIGKENTIYLYGGTGEFNVEVKPKGAIKTTISESGESGEYYFKLTLDKKVSGPIEIIVSEKGNSANKTKINVNIIPNISLKYFKDGLEYTDIKNDDGDDMIVASKGDKFTVKVTGGYNSYKLVPSSDLIFSIDKASKNNNSFVVEIKAKTSGDSAWITIKDKKTVKVKKAYITFKVK